MYFRCSEDLLRIPWRSFPAPLLPLSGGAEQLWCLTARAVIVDVHVYVETTFWRIRRLGAGVSR